MLQVFSVLLLCNIIVTRLGANLSYDQLREAVKEAWKTITVRQLIDLLDSIPDRMQAVIDAQGIYTKF
jgi:hypothetical protein